MSKQPPRGAISAWINKAARHVSEDECLKWPFGTQHRGYGRLRVKSRYVYAHRLICILAHGEPPTEKHQAAHSCGKGHLGCCNPNHLRWATPKENTADMMAHGGPSAPIGSNHGRARLNERDVSEIREAIERGVATAKDIAREYGVHPSTISLAVSGKNWSHV